MATNKMCPRPTQARHEVSCWTVPTHERCKKFLARQPCTVTTVIAQQVNDLRALLSMLFHWRKCCWWPAIAPMLRLQRVRTGITQCHRKPLIVRKAHSQLVTRSSEWGLWYTTRDDTEVVTVTELAHQEAVCQQLCELPVVVIDTEGQNGEVVTLLAPAKDGNYIYLLHNLAITKSLVKLITSKSILKVGFGMANDTSILQRRCGSTMRPVIDMQAWLIPHMRNTGLNAAANKYLSDSKACSRDWAGSVDWKAKFSDINDVRLDYCVKDVELIYRLWDDHNRYSVDNLLPDTFEALDPDEGYSQYLPLDFDCYKTRKAAVQAFLSSNLIKESNKDVRDSAAKAIVDIYWKPMTDNDAQRYVDCLLQSAAEGSRCFKTVEKLTNYIFYTAWSSKETSAERPNSDSHHLYIQEDKDPVDYLLRNFDTEYDIDYQDW